MTYRSIERLSSPEVAATTAATGTAVIPLGSIEQHGPHLPCGTDTIAAQSISHKVAADLGALYVPGGPYGVTPIHAGHPGTISLRRGTFEALLTDILTELSGVGVARFVLVNWHEGNNASIDGVAYTMQNSLGCVVVVAQACYVAQRLYAAQGGELTHGGGIETAAVMAYDPALVDLDRAGTATRPPGAAELDALRRSREVYGFVTNVRELAEQGWYGNPGWATPEIAAKFVDTVATEVTSLVREAFALRETAARQRPSVDG